MRVNLVLSAIKRIFDQCKKQKRSPQLRCASFFGVAQILRNPRSHQVPKKFPLRMKTVQQNANSTYRGIAERAAFFPKTASKDLLLQLS